MISRFATPLAAIVLAAGCARAPAPATPARPTRPAAGTSAAPFRTAAATLRDLQGKVIGTATFTDTYAGVLVDATVRDLGLGEHAMHIHAVGRCEPPFTSAGGHFNPTGREHGFENPNGPHLGDLPNITTPAAGPLHVELLLPGVTLTGRNALLDADGASIVVHEGRDDYKTDPSGNAGGRIACGVITLR